MSPYTTPVIIIPRKCIPGAALAETKRVDIDYQELNRQIPKVEAIQAKLKGCLALTKNSKNKSFCID